MNVKHRIILELKGKKEAKVIWVNILNFSLQFLEVKFLGTGVFSGTQIIPVTKSAVVVSAGILLTWLDSWQTLLLSSRSFFKAFINLIRQGSVAAKNTCFLQAAGVNS